MESLGGFAPWQDFVGLHLRCCRADCLQGEIRRNALGGGGGLPSGNHHFEGGGLHWFAPPLLLALHTDCLSKRSMDSVVTPIPRLRPGIITLSSNPCLVASYAQRRERLNRFPAAVNVCTVSFSVFMFFWLHLFPFLCVSRPSPRGLFGTTLLAVPFNFPTLLSPFCICKEKSQTLQTRLFTAKNRKELPFRPGDKLVATR